MCRTHLETVRAVAQKHGIRLVEVDIESPSAGSVLEAAFGINQSCWGVYNEHHYSAR